jgi:RNA polymerase primary sigma factor
MASLNDFSRTIRIPSNLVQESQKNKRIDVEQLNKTNIDNEQQETDLPYTVGLYNEINEDGDQLIDKIVNKNADNPEDALNDIEEIKKKVNYMLSILDEREKVIIEKSYGLTGIESSLDDLGEEFGCTKERIRQIRDKSLRKLRDNSYQLMKYLGK